MSALITKDTKPAEIEALKPYAKYLMYKCVPVDKPAVEMSFEEMNREQPTWNVDSMIRGMERLTALAENGNIMYDVYTPEECTEDPEKADVKLLYMPAEKQPSDKPFVIAVSGGAYTCVCSIVESFPTAARLNELGYNVFVFNYRCLRDPLFPMPADDLAAAIGYILKNKERFGIQNDEYIVNGYSAGGSLTCIWGAEKTGWKKYGLPRPKALFAIYPFISFDTMENEGMKNWFRSMMFGSTSDDELAYTYDVARNFTAEYPPAYIVQAKDDPAVPVRNSIWLSELMKEHNIPHHLELIETGGHGWGDGSGTDAAGWPDRAADWENALQD